MLSISQAGAALMSLQVLQTNICSSELPGRFLSLCGLCQCCISFFSNHFFPESLVEFKLICLFFLSAMNMEIKVSLCGGLLHILRLLSASSVLSSPD